MKHLKAPAALIVLAALVFVAAACAPAPQAQTIYTRVTEANLKAGADIPAPSGEVILTVTGKIGTSNSSDGSIVMDLATIESVGLVDYKVRDPFEDKDATFRGVLMSDLIALWKVPDDAQTYHMIALNDYVVDIPASDFKEYPVIFALQQDGAYMPVSTRGPAMLVYPYANFEFDHAVYNDRWIWQIKSIEVE